MSRAARIFFIGTRSMIFGIPILPLGAISIYYMPAINRISSRYGSLQSPATAAIHIPLRANRFPCFFE